MQRISHAGAAADHLATNEFNAFYIPMAQVANAATGSSHYSLPTGTGPSIAITSRLSGCMFAVGSDADGTVLVSHIQPHLGTNDLDQRRTDLTDAVTGGFHNQSGSVVRGDGYDQYAAVIGKRTGTEWHFYCQASSYDHGHIIDSATMIA